MSRSQAFYMKTKTTQGARRHPGLRTLTPRRFQNDNWELKVPFEINPVCGPCIGSCGARTQLLGKQGLVPSPRESAGRSQQNKAWGCNVSAAPSLPCTLAALHPSWSLALSHSVTLGLGSRFFHVSWLFPKYALISDSEEIYKIEPKSRKWRPGISFLTLVPTAHGNF